MDRHEALRLLRGGADAIAEWNHRYAEWECTRHPRGFFDLRGADLRGADLRGVRLCVADLRGADLNAADLRDSNLSRADLREADLREARFSQACLGYASFQRARLAGADMALASLTKAILDEADLSGAKLGHADLWLAHLCGADLRGADLSGAELVSTNLDGADLRDASLCYARISRAFLRDADLRGAAFDTGIYAAVGSTRGATIANSFLVGADFRGARFGHTTLAHLDLSGALGLEEAVHAAPSMLDLETLRRSGRGIPEAFLRGCGLSPCEVLVARLYDRGLTPEELGKLLRSIRESWPELAGRPAASEERFFWGLSRRPRVDRGPSP